MLTGLKVPSLTCKYVFYRPEHNSNGIEFWRSWNETEFDITTDRIQRVYEKNGVIWLVITPTVEVINMSKIALFCIFC